MKPSPTIILTTFLLLIAACDKAERRADAVFRGEVATVIDPETRSSKGLDATFFVSEKDLSAYVNYKSLLCGKDLSVVQIESITNKTGDTLIYIIQYDEGWDLLAADKRAPLPLSSSSTGELKLDPRNPMTTWIHCLAEDVLITRRALEKDVPKQGIVEYNINQWKSITADQSVFQDILDEFFPVEQARDSFWLPFPPGLYPGHYELIYVDSSLVYIDSIPHLIPTSWQQTGVSCNSYIPLKSDGSGERAPAGCVAVAGAQVLYYLHSKIGVPYASPTTAYCYGDVTNYTMGQGDYQSSAWSYMDSLGTHPYVGMLIASVAQNVNMLFGNNESSSNYANLYYAFHGYSVAQDYTFYAVTNCDSLILSSLYNQMPVIVFAWPSYDSMDGHAFIIDGYRRQSLETVYTYQWVWDDLDPTIPHPKIPNNFIRSYSSPILTDYYMNWGWDPEYNNDPFAISGDWIPRSGTNNYIYERVLFWNFRNYYE